jgi:hypothetical protein
MVGGLSCISIDICELAGGITGAYVAVRGVKDGIDAAIETVVIGTVSGGSCLFATSISRSL